VTKSKSFSIYSISVGLQSASIYRQKLSCRRAWCSMSLNVNVDVL